MPPSTINSETFSSRDQRDYIYMDPCLKYCPGLSHQQRVIVLYLHDFTLGEGAGGLWLRSMGCHVFCGGAMVDSRAAFGMERVLSDANRALKQKEPGTMQPAEHEREGATGHLDRSENGAAICDANMCRACTS